VISEKALDDQFVEDIVDRVEKLEGGKIQKDPERVRCDEHDQKVGQETQ